MIDDQFTDIYTIEVKNQAIKKAAEAFARAGFKPAGGNWWVVDTYKGAGQDQRRGQRVPLFPGGSYQPRD